MLSSSFSASSNVVQGVSVQTSRFNISNGEESACLCERAGLPNVRHGFEVPLRRHLSIARPNPKGGKPFMSQDVDCALSASLFSLSKEEAPIIFSKPPSPLLLLLQFSSSEPPPIAILLEVASLTKSFFASPGEHVKFCFELRLVDYGIALGVAITAHSPEKCLS